MFDMNKRFLNESLKSFYTYLILTKTKFADFIHWMQ